MGVRTGDKGRNREGGELGNFEAGSDLVAKVTVLAEGTQGHLTGVALDRFSLRGEEPQVWELAVKEVWKVAKPLDRVIHTMGWPLRTGKRFREFGGSFIYPLGEDMVTIGLVVGLDYRDASLSVHDLLQELKTHPKIRKILAGGERLEWGAKTIPSGGFNSLPRELHAPGLLLCGDGVGMVNVPRLKGVHYAIESGRLAAEAAFRALQRGETPASALSSYDEAVRDSFIWSDLHEVRNMRQVFGRGFFVGGALASAMTMSKGRVELGKMRGGAGRRPAAPRHRPRLELPDARRQAHLRQALVGLRLGQQDARRPAEPHPDRAAGAARGRAALGAHVPGAGVRGREGGRGRNRHGRPRPIQLRPVWRDHRQGRPPHSAGRRLGPRVHAHLIYRGFTPKRTRRDHNTSMFSRRFVLLAGVLVALNVTLWFAAPGLALRKAIVTQLFGPSMVRAQVHRRAGKTGTSTAASSPR